MTTVSSFRDVVALWRTPADMAADIGAPVWSARKWPQRDSIPADWWVPIASSSIGQAAGVTVEMLASFAARRAAAAGPSLEDARP